MKTCKYPKCNKQLVGNEKLICKSCSDKIKDGAKKTAVFAGSAGGLVITAIAFVAHIKKDDKS